MSVPSFTRFTSRRTQDVANIKRLSRLYAALSQCNEAIVRCENESELFPKICRAAVENGGMQMAWIGMLDTSSGMVPPVASYGKGLAYLDGFQVSVQPDSPLGRGPVGTAIRENQPCWIQDIENYSGMVPWLGRCKEYGWKGVAALPLTRKHIPVGVLALYTDTTHAFDESARKLLVEMADDISYALGNFAFEAQRKNALKELEFKNALLRTQLDTSPDAIFVVDDNGNIIFYNQQFIEFWPPAKGVVDKGSDAPILQSAVEQAEDPDAFLARVKYLYEHREETGHDELRLKGGRVIDRYTAPMIGKHGEYYGRVWYLRDITERKHSEQELADSEQRFRGLVEQSLAGIYIVQDGKLVYVNPRCAEILAEDSEADLIGRDPLEFIVEADSVLIAERMRQLIAGEKQSVSIEFSIQRKDGKIINVGANASRANYHGSPAILGLIQDISEKKRSEEQIHNYVKQLRNTFLGTVQMVTSLAEMRDPYTAGHERRVAEIAVAIAQEMHLDEQRIEGLRIAGYLHDIGKISIPAEILTKPGRLTPTELRLVQGHAQASYDVLKQVEFPWPVALIAYQHHERLDGSGYPNQLQGGQILLESRIMAVADVVEAMASHRPYRPGLGIDKALAEIERGKGTSYDTSVADACLRLFRERGYELPPYQ